MVLASASLALTACGGSSNDNASSGSSAKPSSSPQSGAAKSGDGTLTVGTLLPQTGDLAFLGPPEFAGVDAAVKDINAAGGVLGKPVKQAKADSGDGTPDIAGQSVDKLLNANADVIIGAAASSVLAERHRQDHRRRCRRVLAGQHLAGVRHLQTTRVSTSAPPRPTSLQGAVLGKPRDRRTATRTSRSWPARTPTARGSPTRSRRRLKEKGATVATKQLYSADATNYTAEVNKVAASKPDAWC